MHDYELKIEQEDGTKKEVRYQALLRALDMEDEKIHGAPLSEGGVPQVISLMQMLQKSWKLKSYQVFYNGSQIA